MQWSQRLKLASVVLVVATCISPALAATVIPDNGPYSGGNSVLITNCVPDIGNGSDITNVTVGGLSAMRFGQGTNYIQISMPIFSSAGAKDIVVQSTSAGNTTFFGAYTVNPVGRIYGGAVETWTPWQEVTNLPAERANLAVGVLNGSLYALGGDYMGAAQSNVYRYEGGAWSEVAPLSGARRGSAVGVLNGALYAVGGDFSTNVCRYNGTNWTEVAGLPAARSSMAAGVLNG